MIWARHGIAARVATPVSIAGTRFNLEYSTVALEVLIFEPIGARRLGRLRLPWPLQFGEGGPSGWAWIKPVYLYDDKEPRDPFDWTGIESK